MAVRILTRRATTVPPTIVYSDPLAAREGASASLVASSSYVLLGTIADLSATPLVESMRLDWTPAENATSHQPQYSTDGETWTPFGSALGASASTVTITGLTAGVSYSGRVVASDGSNQTISNVDTATPTEASAVEPDIFEDFSTYTSTSNMLDDPRGIYKTHEDINTQYMVLDTSVGYGASDRSMRYDYPGGNGSELTITRGIALDDDPVSEMWVEAVVRLDPDFSIENPNVVSSPAWKFLHIGHGEGRWGLGFNHGDDGSFESEAVFQNYSSGSFDSWHISSPSFNIDMLKDGQPHIIRYHVRLDGSNDCHEFWADGVLMGSKTGAINSTVSSHRMLSLCRNINRQPPVDASLWWLQVKVWFSDPGWS